MVGFLLRAVLAELLVGQALFSSYLIAARALPRVPPLLRWTGVVVCGAVLSSVGFHLLSAVGAFHLPGAVLASSLVSIAASRWGPGGPGLGGWLARDGRYLARLYRLCRRSPHRWVVLAFCAASLPVVVRPLILPPLGWDSLTYHAVKAAMWVQHAGELPMQGPGTWAYYPSMWAGGEVFTSWAMLPFHGDLLAAGAEAIQWLALGLALLAFARGLDLREPYASAATGFALAIPTVRISVGSGYVEVALLMMLVSGWALAVEFLKRGSLGAFYLSSAAVGVAAGIKVPVLPLAVVVLAVLALRLASLHLPRAVRLAHVAGGLALFTVIVAPWPWDGIRQTGLPFSPLPVEVFGVRLGEPTPEVAWYLMERPESSGENVSDFGMLRQALLEERMGPGSTTMMAVAASLVAWPFLLRRHSLSLLLLGTSIAVTWAEYASPGFWVVRRYFASSGVRFLLPALIPAVISSVAFCRRLPGLGRIYLLFLVGGTFFHLLLYLPYGVSAKCAAVLPIVVAGIACTFFAMRWIARTRLPVGPRLAGGMAVLAIALFGLHELRDQTRVDLFRRDFTIHPIHPYWLDAAVAADSGQVAHRIAVTSGPMQDLDNWIVYPLLGRALRNEVSYVPVSRDGEIRHFGSGTLNEDYVRTAEYASWWARLQQREVTDVMSFRPASIELAWMESRPAQFRRLAGQDGDWGFFEVLRPGRP